MKIALWVHKNIKYDLNYAGRDDLTAIDIYNFKVGVCDHFTRLSNALLYSLGYKVIFVTGYITIDNNNQNARRTWSITKIKNKWYPLIQLGELYLTNFLLVISFQIILLNIIN